MPKIAGTLSSIQEVDLNENSSFWGEFFRVRIFLYTSKPLCYCLDMIHI